MKWPDVELKSTVKCVLIKKLWQTRKCCYTEDQLWCQCVKIELVNIETLQSLVCFHGWKEEDKKI